MTVSITDIERACDRVKTVKPTEKGISSYLRSQGLKFSDQQFRRLWGQLQGKKPKSRQLSLKLASASADPVSVAVRATLADPEALPLETKPLYGGKLKSDDEFRPRLEGKRFVFTCAQNNTMLHEGFWKSLQTFCDHNDAQLGVSRITYNKNAWNNLGGVTKKKSLETDDIWYDERIVPYIADEQVKVADSLVFCGELDILPTAVYPLNGLANYTGPHSAIIPHTKLQMQALATMKGQDAKHLYSTGAVTLRNYIQRRTGQVASYHHVYGALYVELDDKGDWWVRQINADDQGIFYELDKVYGPGWVADAKEFGKPIINLGDIHVEKTDDIQMQGAMDMLKVLDPEAVVVHDLLDFEGRNHHNKRDPFFLATMYWEQKEKVESGFLFSYDFLLSLKQRLPDATIYSIRSNHDEAFKKWLTEGTGFPDAPNLEFWHRANARLHKAIKQGEPKYDIYKWALQEWDEWFHTSIEDFVTFIQEDDSLVLHGIEFGLHGHLGPNGARGNPKAYRQIGRRANTGHTHSAGIVDGIYTAGVLAKLDMGYNKGPSSWSCSHILTYANGKRAIITQRGYKWRA